MSSRWHNSSPEQWDTREILKWIVGNIDSHGEIKNRIMSVVQTNDLDGHTLKQLAVEKDEIQCLFPSLKERLAFKSMLRKLFKDEYQASSQSDQPSFSKISPAVPTNTCPQPQPRPAVSQSFHGGAVGGGFTPSPLPQAEPPRRNLAPIQFMQKDTTPIMQPRSMLPLYHHAMGESNHQPLEKRQRLSSDRTQAVVTMFAPGTQQLRQAEAPAPAQNHKKTTCLQKGHATANTTALTHGAPLATSIPANNQAVQVEHATLSTAVTQSKLQISSVTSFAKTERLSSESEPEPLHPVNDSKWDFTSAQEESLLPDTHIDYPAPIPEFSDQLQELLRSCEGEINKCVRRMMVRECGRFYVEFTRGHRLNFGAYANIGRTLAEKYPALDCDESSISSFVKSLGGSIRNLRRRLKNRRRVKELYKIDYLDDTPEDAMGDDTIEISDDEADVYGDDGGEILFVIKEEQLA